MEAPWCVPRSAPELPTTAHVRYRHCRGWLELATYRRTLLTIASSDLPPMRIPKGAPSLVSLRGRSAAMKMGAVSSSITLALSHRRCGW